MFFTQSWFLIGVAFSLETMRRTFIGGSSLALFIIKEFGLDRQAAPTHKMLTEYLDIEQEMIDRIPPWLGFLVSPWIDHHDAGMTYLQILGILAESQRPKGCEYYWEREEKL